MSPSRHFDRIAIALSAICIVHCLAVPLAMALLPVAAIAFGTDGTIYTAGYTQVIAIDPSGTIDWQFAFDANADILAGPGVGPDGNIYAVSGTEPGGYGLGVFSLTPQGQLRWSDAGQPVMASINAPTIGRIHFTADRLLATTGLTTTGDFPIVVFAIQRARCAPRGFKIRGRGIAGSFRLRIKPLIIARHQ